MTKKELFENLNLKYHDQFRKFMNTGEGTPEFLELIVTDPALNKAVDDGFEIQGEVLREIGQIVKEGKKQEVKTSICDYLFLLFMFIMVVVLIWRSLYIMLTF